jgi:CubicO group peptidase (beta-lactamase class C family)
LIIAGSELESCSDHSINLDVVALTPTSRHLLTHTSGISHPCWNPVLYQYVSSQGRPPVSLNSAGRVDRILSFPLMFEPGTSWEYGAGLDWAGKVVERLTGMSLQQYMESNIWMPLGMDSCTFRLTERPDVQAKLVRKMTREGLHHPHYGTTTKPNGRLIPVDDEDLTVSIGRDAKVVELPDDYCEEYEEGTDDLGGSGIYSSAPDFARLLHTLCFGDACDKILSKTMVDEMFTPQLSASTRAALISFFSIKEVRDIFGQGIGPIALDFGLGGLLVQEDVPSRSSSPMPGRPHTPQHVRGNINRSVSASPQLSRYTRRRKGSMFWSSLQNIHWWMDRETGVSGVYASQLIPQGDPRSLHWLGRYEEMIYEKIGC